MDQNIELVKLSQKGDTHAFAQLYACIYKDLYRFALYSLQNREDAEDVVSEAVIDAFASITKLRKADAFRSWIFRILSNKCKDKMKQYQHKTIDWEDMEENLPYLEDTTDSIYVRKIFGKLEEEERLIISMHVFGGYTSREIARMLSMNANTVRTKESRAFKKLADWLNQEEM